MNRRLIIALSIAAALFIPLAAAAAGPEVDHAIFAELLARHVRAGGVDYAGFKAEEERLDRYLSLLENTDPDALGREEQLAFYINAYNAWTIKLILTGYPGVKSIKDLGSLFQSPWKKEIVRLQGKRMTLDDIEHNILRPRFKDPRVHFAINCASKGCPPLIPEPYRGAVLNEQLDRVTRGFLNAPGSFRLEGGTLWVSSIFKWFAEDFNHDPKGFYRAYADPPLRDKLAGNLSVKYLDYDWSLNGL